MPSHSKTPAESHRRRFHIVWSKPEREQIVREARPDLAGLPLLRIAMQSLPPHRRRRLAALSQVSWFEPALQAASRAKLAQPSPDERLISGVETIRDSADKILGVLRSIQQALEEFLARFPEK